MDNPLKAKKGEIRWGLRCKRCARTDAKGSWRYTNTGKCAECVRRRNAEFYQLNKEKLKENQKQRYWEKINE